MSEKLARKFIGVHMGFAFEIAAGIDDSYPNEGQVEGAANDLKGLCFALKALDKKGDLVKEIKALESKLTKAVEALRFYGDKKNWGYVCEDEYPDFQGEDDLECGEDNKGGKKAREALKEIGEQG